MEFATNTVLVYLEMVASADKNKLYLLGKMMNGANERIVLHHTNLDFINQYSKINEVCPRYYAFSLTPDALFLFSVGESFSLEIFQVDSKNGVNKKYYDSSTTSYAHKKIYTNTDRLSLSCNEGCKQNNLSDNGQSTLLV
jgi:hypothetical protein